MSDEGRCDFCGKVHDLGPIGEPGTVFAGIRILMCAAIPEEHLYVDTVYERGPRGQLVRLSADG